MEGAPQANALTRNHKAAQGCTFQPIGVHYQLRPPPPQIHSRSTLLPPSLKHTTMLKSTYRPASSVPETPLPEGWTEHTAPSGHKYYYNTTTQKSTYIRPAPADEELQIDFNATQPDYEIKASLTAQNEFQRNNGSSNDPSNTFPDQRQPAQPGSTASPAYPDRPRRRGHGGDRPKSKKPITNLAPWVLVQTKFGRRFVHNTDTKQSLWKFPSDVMMAVIEMDRLEWESKRAAEGEKQEVERPEAAKKALESGEKQSREDVDGEDGDEYEEVEVTDDEGEEDGETSKRPRLDTNANAGGGGPVEYDEDDIEWQLAQMDAYDDDEDPYPNDQDMDGGHDGQGKDGDGGDRGEDEGLPMTEEDNIALFRSLLDDFHISPYSTFDKILENSQLIEDERYVALPNMHSRREVFTAWSRDRVAEMQEQQAEQEAARKVDPKVEYLKFLSEHASTKLFWPEFRRKYRKDAIMTGYELSDKEREKSYREFVAKLKTPEQDRRKDLLGLLKGSTLKRGMKPSDLPETVLKDVRYWIVSEKRREEVVVDFIASL
jgi:hypothetical protein